MKNLSQIHQDIQNKVIDRVHDRYTSFLNPLTTFLLKNKIKANHITLIAFLFGIIGAIFLFVNHAAFVILMIVHILFDILDGSLARREGPTLFGKWFDYLSDRLITFTLLLIILLQEMQMNQGLQTVTIVALALFLIHHGIYIIKKMNGAVVYSRSLLIIALIFQQYTLGIILVIILSSLGLISQIVYVFRNQ